MVYPSAAGALWRGALDCLYGYPKIFSHSLHVLCPSPLGLAASVVASTMLLIVSTHSLQLLAYMYFAVAAMLYLSEGSTSYYVLSYKAIS